MSKVYEPGVMYEEDKDKVKICSFGMHACKEPWDCYTYYSTDCPVWEVTGEVVDTLQDKVVCSKLKLIKPVDWSTIPRPSRGTGRMIVRRLPWETVKIIMLKHKTKDLWSAVANYYLWEAITDPDIKGMEKYLPSRKEFNWRVISDDHLNDVVAWLIKKRKWVLASAVINGYLISLSIEDWNKVNGYLDDVGYVRSCPEELLIEAYKSRPLAELLKRIIKSTSDIKSVYEKIPEKLINRHLRAEWLETATDYQYAIEHNLLQSHTVPLSIFFTSTSFSSEQMLEICRSTMIHDVEKLIVHPDFKEEHAEHIIITRNLRTVKPRNSDYDIMRIIQLLITKFSNLADIRMRNILKDKYMTKEILGILGSPTVDKLVVRRHLRNAGTRKWFKELFPLKYEEYQEKGWIKK